jgi:hypothetical protein
VLELGLTDGIGGGEAPRGFDDLVIAGGDGVTDGVVSGDADVDSLSFVDELEEPRSGEKWLLSLGRKEIDDEESACVPLDGDVVGIHHARMGDPGVTQESGGGVSADDSDAALGSPCPLAEEMILARWTE